jgi:hypothetical protein
MNTVLQLQVDEMREFLNRLRRYWLVKSWFLCPGYCAARWLAVRDRYYTMGESDVSTYSRLAYNEAVYQLYRFQESL